MKKTIEQLRSLRVQGQQRKVTRGRIPGVRFDGQFKLRFIGIFILTVLLSWVLLTTFFMAYHHKTLWASLGISWGTSLECGLAVTLFYFIYPVLVVLFSLFKNRRLPGREILHHFHDDQILGCVSLIVFSLFYLGNHLYPSVMMVFVSHHLPLHWMSSKPPIGLWWEIIFSLVIAIVLLVIIPRFYPTAIKVKPAKKKDESAPFGLWLGLSTGDLSRLSHRTGIFERLNIVLNTEDAAQNILVLGGIGSGKTTRLMQPLLGQLLDQNCGGLLFDVKGDVKKAALQLGEMTDRPVVVIGPNHNHMNLLAGLTPEVAASFLKSGFLVNGGSKLDGFWIDTATELCRNTLGLLSFLPEHYTLQGLYSYLFDDEIKEALQAEINPLLVTLEEKEQRLLKSYLRYHDSIFSTFDEKVKSGVNATVAQALSPFNHPDLIDAFCAHSENNFRMESVLDGTVYLVDMPLARWGLGGKVAYTFIKLRFFNVMQNRVHNPQWNQDRPVFFMCDEYQELISASKDGLSDLNFWDKSRSSKTIGIISAQSVSSFYAALGDHDLAHAILQNFRQKLCFRIEDQATLNMMDKLAGQAKVYKKTTSQTTGSGSSSNAKSLFDSTSKNLSSTQSITETRESVLDATLFRKLSPDEAVALLSIHGHSMDDVIELLPLFL